MKNYLKAELWKLFRNHLFWATLAVGILCAVTSAVHACRLYDGELGPAGILSRLRSQGDSPKENYLVSMTLYNSWMNAEIQSPGAKIFFLITPVLASLPTAWSFFEEIHSSYLHLLVPKKGRKVYFSAKILVAFLTGGCLISLPQLLNLWLVAMHIPAIRPNVLYSLYASVDHGDLFSGLFYSHPLCFCFAILGMDFIFGGLFALMSLAASFYVRSHLGAVAIPYIVLLVVDACRSFQYYISYIEISPIFLLHPNTAPNSVQLPAVIFWEGMLLLVTVPVILRKGCKLEIL